LNSDGINGFSFSHDGFFSSGYLSSGTTDTNQACADVCMADPLCVAFSRHIPLASCYMYYEGYGAVRSKVEDKAYLRCQGTTPASTPDFEELQTVGNSNCEVVDGTLTVPAAQGCTLATTINWANVAEVEVSFDIKFCQDANCDTFDGPGGVDEHGFFEPFRNPAGGNGRETPDIWWISRASDYGYGLYAGWSVSSGLNKDTDHNPNEYHRWVCKFTRANDGKITLQWSVDGETGIHTSAYQEATTTAAYSDTTALGFASYQSLMFVKNMYVGPPPQLSSAPAATGGYTLEAQSWCVPSDVTGTGLQWTQYNTDTINTCKDLCSSTPACYGFGHRHSDNLCEFYNDCGTGERPYPPGCSSCTGHDLYYKGGSRRLGGEDTHVVEVKRKVPKARRLTSEFQERQCMQCVAGLAPELSDCNPGNAARYLGHAKCCGVWDVALDQCLEHCTEGMRTRKLATCDKLITGEKSEDVCDECLERQAAGTSLGSDCNVWKNLLPLCSGPCEASHRDYASCGADKEEEETPAVVSVATKATCQRCVLARSPEVSDCLPRMNGQVMLDEEECCAKWDGWLSSCAADCPAPVMSGCDLPTLVTENLVVEKRGWSQAAVCETCMRRMPEGSACMAAPQAECCDHLEMSWSSMCYFECGVEGLDHMNKILCSQRTMGDMSMAPAVALLSLALLTA